MQMHEDILVKDEDMIMINEIKTALADLSMGESSNELVRWGLMSTAASGSRFTLSPNLDAHCPAPESGLTSIKIRKLKGKQASLLVSR
jgi:hypothetical protein